MRALTRILAPFFLAALAGCEDAPKDNAVTERMLQFLHSRPVGSYALVPTYVTGEPVNETGRMPGYQALILKAGAFKNDHAFTTGGVPAQALCSTFNLITTRLNEKGEVTTEYQTRGRWSVIRNEVIDLSKDTATVPAEIKEDDTIFYLRSNRAQNYCTYVPLKS